MTLHSLETVQSAWQVLSALIGKKSAFKAAFLRNQARWDAGKLWGAKLRVMQITVRENAARQN